LRRFGRVVLLDHLVVSTSCRRWNLSFLRSLSLYASNFVWLQIAGRPLWQGFPEIREAMAPARPPGLTRGDAPRVFTWGAAQRVTGVALVAALIAVGGYDTFAPWSNAFGRTYWEGSRRQRVVALTFDDG